MCVLCMLCVRERVHMCQCAYMFACVRESKRERDQGRESNSACKRETGREVKREKERKKEHFLQTVKNPFLQKIKMPSAGRQRFTRGDQRKDFFCFLFFYFSVLLFSYIHIFVSGTPF